MVEGRGNAGTSLNGIYTGQLAGAGFPTGSGFQGLAIQATSSESLFGLVIAGGGGFVGVGGAIGVSLMHVITKAFIGLNSHANFDQAGAGSFQDVNISAVDATKTLTIGRGVAARLFGLAPSLDIGVAQTTTQAYVENGVTLY